MHCHQIHKNHHFPLIFALFGTGCDGDWWGCAVDLSNYGAAVNFEGNMGTSGLGCVLPTCVV